MPASDAFSERQRDDIGRAVRIAEKDTGLRFAVYVGPLGPSSRERALVLHGALGAAADRAVLVAVDPGGRTVEIVTGPEARRYLDDRAAALGALTMQGQLVTGDLAAAIVNGIRTLAEHARHPRVLHLDQP